MKTELFIIPPDTLSAALADKDSLHATVDGLKQLDLLKLPYPRVDIKVAVEYPTELTFKKGANFDQIEGFLNGTDAYIQLAHQPTCMACTFIGVDIDGNFKAMVIELAPPEYKRYTTVQANQPQTTNNCSVSQGLAHTLCVLLATKNTIKVTKEHKLAKLGIGPKKGEKSYPRVTTISLPSTLPLCEDHPPTGKTVCAHLRRGHNRRQRYGPKLAFVREIWIEPCFVNADPDFVSTRRAYNLSFKPETTK